MPRVSSLAKAAKESGLAARLPWTGRISFGYVEDVAEVFVRLASSDDARPSPLGAGVGCPSDPRRHRPEQFRVVALNVETAFHAFGVRERWRVQQDQVVSLFNLLQPVQAAILNQQVTAFVQAIVRQVFAQPGEVGFRHIHTGGGARPA